MSHEAPRLAGVVGCRPELAARYRARRYWAGVTLGAEVERWAAEHGDRIALVADGHSISYVELEARSRRVAGHLHAFGIRRDDRIVVQLGNETAFCDLLLGAMRLGALPVMALPAHRAHEIGYLVAHVDAVALAIPDTAEHRTMARALRTEHPGLRHVLVGAGIAEPSGEVLDLVGLAATEPPSAPVLETTDSEDVALFLLSGGTTGLPKLIPRTHDDYLYNARASADLCGLTAASVYLAVLPVSHNFPLACPGLLGTWGVGGRVVMAPDPSPTTAFGLLAQERVTVTALVPALAIRWLEQLPTGAADGTLELLQIGGARLLPETARRIPSALGCTVQQVFGMAEGLLNYTRCDDPDEVVVETQGRPLCADDEVRIVDAAGDDVGPGEGGELLTRGPYTLCGYYRAEEHNARAFTPDGFYRTGDVVRADAQGNLVVLGRAKDMINRGGEKVSAEEVEDLLLGHPAVRNAAAVAMPDAVLGERTCAYVVPVDGATLELEALKAYLATRGAAKFKWPERLELVTELPLTKIGKVDKAALRADVLTRLDGTVR